MKKRRRRLNPIIKVLALTIVIGATIGSKYISYQNEKIEMIMEYGLTTESELYDFNLDSFVSYLLK